MGPATVPYIQNAGVSIQTAENKHQFRALLYTIMAIINFIVSILLCRRFGGIGCAFGTALSIIIANILIMNIYYHRSLKLNMIRFWKEELSFVPCIVALAVVGVIINIWIPINSYIMLLLAGLIFVVIYFVVLWIFSLNIDEKNMVKSILKIRM